MSGEDSHPGSWEQGDEISQPGPRRKRKEKQPTKPNTGWRRATAEEAGAPRPAPYANERATAPPRLGDRTGSMPRGPRGWQRWGVHPLRLRWGGMPESGWKGGGTVRGQSAAA